MGTRVDVTGYQSQTLPGLTQTLPERKPQHHHSVSMLGGATLVQQEADPRLEQFRKQLFDTQHRLQTKVHEHQTAHIDEVAAHEKTKQQLEESEKVAEGQRTLADDLKQKLVQQKALCKELCREQLDLLDQLELRKTDNEVLLQQYNDVKRKLEFCNTRMRQLCEHIALERAGFTTEKRIHVLELKEKGLIHRLSEQNDDATQSALGFGAGGALIAGPIGFAAGAVIGAVGGYLNREPSHKRIVRELKQVREELRQLRAL